MRTAAEGEYGQGGRCRHMRGRSGRSRLRGTMRLGRGTMMLHGPGERRAVHVFAGSGWCHGSSRNSRAPPLPSTLPLAPAVVLRVAVLLLPSWAVWAGGVRPSAASTIRAKQHTRIPRSLRKLPDSAKSVHAALWQLLQKISNSDPRS